MARLVRSAPGAAVLAIALFAFAVSIVGGDALWETVRPVFQAAYLAFPIGWLVLGLQAVRLGRPTRAPASAG
jgi:hypothetical protein